VSRTGPGWSRTTVLVARAVLVHPSLTPAALGALRRMAPPGWWRRPPYLPVPAPEYWRFRLKTAFGDDQEAALSVADVTAYLRWCRQTRPRPT
jgi:hypothetical protein